MGIEQKVSNSSVPQSLPACSLNIRQLFDTKWFLCCIAASNEKWSFNQYELEETTAEPWHARSTLSGSICKKNDQHLVRLWTVNSPCGQSRALHSGSTRQSSWNDSAGDMACFFNMTMIPTTPPPSLIWPKTKFKDLGSSTATTLLI